MRFLRLCVLVMITSFVSLGCVETLFTSSLEGPDLTESDYLKTIEARFLIDLVAGKTESRYYVRFETTDDMPQTPFLVFEFEDPANPENFHIVKKQLRINETKFAVTSPPISHRKSYENYLVRVRIYTDAARSTYIGDHEQQVRSLIDDVK